jgi:hypothetical protein
MWDLQTLIFLNEKAVADYNAQEKVPPAEAAELMIQDLERAD